MSGGNVIECLLVCLRLRGVLFGSNKVREAGCRRFLMGADSGGKKALTGRQRVLKAINHEPADRV
ncbi:MAG: hypothetical protein JXN61_15280, partial [Sedimentisphaerales bacterium]|nr:hypothetical protein [Sedimentisphaerales bacterium]